jgi:LDH2 family malate/lactate/ureidoglycolate dehydrogenase
MGVFTHGTKLLSGYIRKLHGGGYVAAAQPLIERQGPGWAIIDGHSALGQVSSLFAVRTAIEKAKQSWDRLRRAQKQRPHRCGGLLCFVGGAAKA